MVWAKALWTKSAPIGVLTRAYMRALANLEGKVRVWSSVSGPAAAMMATCARIGWRANSTSEFETEEGAIIDLAEMCPMQVKWHVDRATQ